MENLVHISESQVTHLEWKDPYIEFSICLFSSNYVLVYVDSWTICWENWMDESFWPKWGL